MHTIIQELRYEIINKNEYVQAKESINRYGIKKQLKTQR